MRLLLAFQPRSSLAALVLLLSGPLGCAHHSAASHEPASSGHASQGAASNSDEALEHIAAIHGGAGPWVVAGYRMGRYAIAKLGLEAQSFDLEVIHHSPHEVQYSCIADGASAATGASVGKLNLSLVDTDAVHTATTYVRRSTGQKLTLRPTAAFVARFRDVPRDGLATAGRAVLSLRDDEIFESAPAP